MSRASLIINSPFEHPRYHWHQGSGTALSLVEDRRAASHEVIDVCNNTQRMESPGQASHIRGREKIRDSWESLHRHSPRMDQTQRPDRVILSLPLVSMLPDAVLAALGDRFGSRFGVLDKDAVQVLATAEMEGSVSNQRLQEILTLHRRDITGLLKSLVREGFLVPDGVGRGTRYGLGGGIGVPAVTAIPPDKASAPPDKAPIPPDSALIPPDSRAVHPDNAGSPPYLALIAIAEPVRSTQRVERAVTRRVILALCQGRFLTLRELSDLLQRGPETLRNGFISPMVNEGALELRYPDKPSRRDQAYRTRPEPAKRVS